MAQHVSVLLIDDINGEEAERTVQFGLDGRDYEIDLTKAHAEELEQSLAKFIEKARRVSASPTRSRGTARRSTSTGPDPARVRKWAAMNGIEVNERGRIPKDIIERYEASNGKAPAASQTPEKPAEEEKPKQAEKPAQKAAEKPQEQSKTAAKKPAASTKQTAAAKEEKQPQK